MNGKVINKATGFKSGSGPVEIMYNIELEDGSRHIVIEDLNKDVDVSDLWNWIIQERE